LGTQDTGRRQTKNQKPKTPTAHKTNDEQYVPH
jgi:hypothetical protein